jgi:hypothetical protein
MAQVVLSCFRVRRWKLGLYWGFRANPRKSGASTRALDCIATSFMAGLQWPLVACGCRCLSVCASGLLTPHAPHDDASHSSAYDLVKLGWSHWCFVYLMGLNVKSQPGCRKRYRSQASSQPQSVCLR